MKSWPLSELLERFAAGDWQALSRAITIVENDSYGKETVMRMAFQCTKKDCLVLGLTGAGGAGKSTLISRIIADYRSRSLKVGVLAIDPSSSLTGGAFLGDRLRMGQYNSDAGVFIRSFASRGTLGGLSQGAKDALYLYKAFGFHLIIIETLGVGQEETDISNFSDVTAVVLAPGNGDHIQMAKAGTQEIADIFVVNKADKTEAEGLFLQLQSVLEILPDESRPLLVRTTASDGGDIGMLLQAIACASERNSGKRAEKNRTRIEHEIRSRALQHLDSELRIWSEQLTDEVLTGKMTPYEAGLCLSKMLHIP